MQIEFTEIAKQTLQDQIAFLERVWTAREVGILLQDVKKIVMNLKVNRFNHYQEYSRGIRSALIGKKHVRMFFRKENDNLITVLFFFDVRQDPNKILELLK